MLSKKIRKFNTKSKLNIELSLIKKINLKKDQQITFVEHSKGKIKEYDVVKKDWGYYATPSINKRLKKFRNHGMERIISTKKKFHWKYSIKEPSFNFRLSEINCALACSQLNKISFLLKERKKIAEIYIKLFKENKNHWKIYLIL